MPGDVVIIEGGDIVTADVRLVTGSRLQADESALTGESVPVEKGVDAVKAESPLAERSCMLFKGTAVTRGSGEAVIVATGMKTELGRISSLTENRMTVSRFALESGEFEVSGEGKGEGSFLLNGQPTDPSGAGGLLRALQVGVLCRTSRSRTSGQKKTAIIFEVRPSWRVSIPSRNSISSRSIKRGGRSWR